MEIHEKSFAIYFEAFRHGFGPYLFKGVVASFCDIISRQNLAVVHRKKKLINFVVSANSGLGNIKFGKKERRNLPGPFIWTLRSPPSFAKRG